jgi:hypothetical protein
MTVYIVKIKIHQNITEQFSYIGPKKCSMSGTIFAFQEKLRYVLRCNLWLGTFRNIHSIFKKIYCIVVLLIIDIVFHSFFVSSPPPPQML